MGYIFDAMNQSDAQGDEAEKQASSSIPPETAVDHQLEKTMSVFHQLQDQLEAAEAERPIDTQLNLPGLPGPIAHDTEDELQEDSQQEPINPQPSVDAFGSDDVKPADQDNVQASSDDTVTHEQTCSPPSHSIRYDDRVVAITQPDSTMSEQYRSIRTSLLARWQNNRHLVHTITSATPQEGKTITTMNLGLIFAELQTRRTLVIEADLRLPTFAKLLHCEKRPGLTEYLAGECEFSDMICRVEGTSLDVIFAGRHSGTQTIQRLSSNRMSALLDQVRRTYDHILIDTPPVVELADAGVLGALSDEVLLVVRMNRTPRTMVEQATRILASYNAPVAGLIATDHPSRRRRYYAYRYGYRYRYNQKQATAA